MSKSSSYVWLYRAAFALAFVAIGGGLLWLGTGRYESIYLGCLLAALACWAIYVTVDPSVRLHPFKGRVVPVLLGTLLLFFLLLLLVFVVASEARRESYRVFERAVRVSQATAACPY